jgi:hypothetical protein
MRRPFSTITALLLVVLAVVQGAQLWFGWVVTVDRLAMPPAASWALIGVALALAIGLWFEARMHAHLAYGRRGDYAAVGGEPRRGGDTFRAPKPFTVRKGRRYRATIVLGFFEQVASNDTIAAMLGDAGFSDVAVSGSGSRRSAEALWAGDDTTADMPSQIVSAVEIPPAIGAAPISKPSPSPQAVEAAAAPPPPPRPTSPSIASAVPQGLANPVNPPPVPSAAGAAPRPQSPPPQAKPPAPPPQEIEVSDATDTTRRPSIASRFASALTGRSKTAADAPTVPPIVQPARPTPPAPPPSPTPPRSAAAPAAPASATSAVPTVRNQKPPPDTAS